MRRPKAEADEAPAVAPGKDMAHRMRVWRTAAALGLIGCWAGGAEMARPATAPAQVPVAFAEPSIDGQVDEAYDDLVGASKAVNQARDELAKIAADLPGAQRRLDASAQASADADQAHAEATAQVAAAQAKVALSEAQVASAEAQIRELQGRIAAMARRAYISGDGYQELEVLLGSRDPADFASALAAVTRRSRGNNTAFTELAAAQERLAGELVQVGRLRDEAEQHRAEAARRASAAADATVEAADAKRAVDVFVARKRKALQTASSHRRSIQRMYNELRAEQRRIARAAAEAARREAERQRNRHPAGGAPGADPAPPADSGPSPAPGELTWPIPGARAGGRTGWRVHPVYGYRSCHTGDDISAGSGTAIRSAAAGTVASVASGGPYGNHTLVAHAGNLSTMYAHQSRIIVREGQRVSAGQTIGYVGSTGWSTGPHLHFEVHVRGVPYEPMGWFGEGSRHAVSCWSG